MTQYYFDVSVSTTTPFETLTIWLPSDWSPPMIPSFLACAKCYAVADNLAMTVSYSNDPSVVYSLTRDTTITVSNAVLVTSSKTVTADFTGLTIGVTYDIQETCSDDALSKTASLTAAFVSGSAQFTNMQTSVCASDRYLLITSVDGYHTAVAKITIT